jgi:hypothetical protein
VKIVAFSATVILAELPAALKSADCNTFYFFRNEEMKIIMSPYGVSFSFPQFMGLSVFADMNSWPVLVCLLFGDADSIKAILHR